METLLSPEIVKLGMVEDETQIARMTQVEEINFQMQVRSANMVSYHPRLSSPVHSRARLGVCCPSLPEGLTENVQIQETFCWEEELNFFYIEAFNINLIRL